MIARDPSSAAKGSHDVIVIGGGIYGVSVALECVARRLRPLLVERSDFAEETTSNSLRIVHGGLRYLQRLDFRRFRRSVRQRRWWLRTFPELVRPLPCLMPLYGQGLHRPSILRLALGLNDVLSAGRNRSVRNDRVILGGRILNREGTLDLFPGCRTESLRGAALWNDAVMESPHRLVVEMLRWVTAAGGAALNYVSARELRVEGGRVAGVLAVDELTGQELDLSAPLVVNAAGPWSARVASTFDREHDELFRPSLAFNLLLRRRLPARVAVAVAPPGPEASIRFLQPTGDLTFAGTVHAPYADGGRGASAGSGAGPDNRLITEYLDELNRAMPGFGVSPDDVIRVFWGRLPATEDHTAGLRTHPMLVDHGREGGPRGLFSVSGVKFTTAPAVARMILDRARGARSRSDWDAVARSRPEMRSWPKPPGGQGDAADPVEVLRREVPALRRLVREEAVIFAEDLVRRRLDWNLADLDLERVGREVATLLPELSLRSSVRSAR